MTTLPALPEHAPIELRLDGLSFTGREIGLTRRTFILGCLNLAATQVTNLFGRLSQLPLLRIRFP
jgi:hypothetical protein